MRVHDFEAARIDGLGRPVNCLCLAMQFVEGVNLRTWLAEHSAEPGEVLGLVIDAGRGLVAAHEAGLVHRDFKPENVMVDQSDQARTVDFGLARSSMGADASGTWVWGDPRGKDASGPAATRIGGTPGYMAPEALNAVANEKTDQYAFAATVWEALSGELPIPAESPDFQLYRSKPFHGGEQIDPDYRQILERALSYSPERTLRRPRRTHR